MALNCIIVDDDKTSQTVLKALVLEHDQLNLLEVAANGKQALDLTKKYDLNLVFLDVSMPVMNGFEFLDHLERHNYLKVILVTSEKEYALKAFEYNISDYLLKPVSKHRFKQAIDWVVQSAGSDDEYKRITKNDLLIRELIQFMISSNTDVLVPQPSAESNIGYTYPLLRDNFEFDQPSDMFQILEFAEDEGILAGSFVDLLRLCRTCSNSTFSIKQSCPNCGSLKLKEVLANSGHKKGASAFCCTYCRAQFRKPVLKVRCEHCENMQDVTHLRQTVLKKYKLTEEGKKLAEGNLYFKNDQL